MINNKEYPYRELLYVCKKDGWYNNWQNGMIVLYKGYHKGNYDLSYHGTPYYETFIECERLDNYDDIDFGDEKYCWRPVKEYIKDLQDKILHIKDLAQI